MLTKTKQVNKRREANVCHANVLYIACSAGVFFGPRMFCSRKRHNGETRKESRKWGESKGEEEGVGR